MKVNPYTYARCRAIARRMKMWPKRPPPKPSYLATEGAGEFIGSARLIRAGERKIKK